MQQKAFSRRNILLGAGGAFVPVGIGATWHATRLPEDAIRPWQMVAPDADIRLHAFRHAVLAPNPHNRQPWEIHLIGTNEALLTCDLDRRLPQTDPFDRQITIGFGCFIEIAAIAAAERGFRVDVTPFPEGAPQVPTRLDRRPIAHLVFTRDQDVQPDPLFAAVRFRRSAKMPYNLTRAVPSDAFSALAGVAKGGLKTAHAATSAELASLRAVCQRAWDVEYTTARTWQESVNLIRVGAREVNANPDGIALTGPFFESLSLLGTDAVRAQAAIPYSKASASTVKRYADLFIATPAMIWISTKGNLRDAQINAGRAYTRQNLIAASRDLSMQPVSQALQEYPEMAEQLSHVRRLCGIEADETLQMLARLGYAEVPVSPTPRWPLEKKIRF
ncbi:Nitroreductase [Rhabdaerophilaceae bacterium]